MHRRMNTWLGRNMVCLSADQFAENLLENSEADVKRSRLEGRNGIWCGNGLWNFLTTQRRHGEKFPHLHLRQTVMCPKCEHKECTRTQSGSELSGQKSAELPDAWHARLPVWRSHTLANADRIKMPGTRAAEPHQRRRNVESLWIRIHDRWTRVRVQRIPSRRGRKRPLRQTPADQMDEDNFRRGPATPHQLEPVDDGNVSKKARVARNVLHIEGEDNVKFDVNEEAWPNADLAIHSSYEGTLIDGLLADKVKAGDEREIKQMKDLQLCSWVKETDIPPDKSIWLTGWARRMKGSEVRSRCVLKDFATTLRVDVFAWIFAGRSMV